MAEIEKNVMGQSMIQVGLTDAGVCIKRLHLACPFNLVDAKIVGDAERLAKAAETVFFSNKALA